MLADPPRAVKADEAQRAGTSEHTSEEPYTFRRQHLKES